MAKRNGIRILVRHSILSHAQAGMTAYKKTPVGTTNEVTDETILPVEGFGAVEVDLDQPDTTTKPVKLVFVAYVPGCLRNLLSTREAVEQWGKPLVYYKTKAALGFPGGGIACFKLLPPQGIVFCNRCETHPESRGSAGDGSKND